MFKSIMAINKNYNHYNGYQGYKLSPIFIQLTIVFDYTTEFCQTYIDIGYKNYKGYKSYKNYSRQADQLIQAARSSKQCWAEGALEKSTESKLKMWGVSRASLEELLQDYLDFLRQRRLPLWGKDDPRAVEVRKIAYKNYKSYNDYENYLKNPEEAANAMICLINQTNQLIDQKYRWEEEKFVKEGGFRENLFKKRIEYRRKKFASLRGVPMPIGTTRQSKPGKEQNV